MNRSEWVAAARRRMPASTIGVRAGLGAALDARNAQTLGQARRSMELLLGAARPEVDLDPVARRYLRQMRWMHEARWHPDAMPPLRVEGRDRLDAVAGGVLVSFVHHGPFPVIGVSLAEQGREVHAMANDDICVPRHPWQRQIREIATAGGGRLFSRTEGSAGIRDRLERGLVVAVASDVPGRTPVRFLGRDLVGSSGAVRIAWTAGVPVVACTTWVGEDGRPFYRLEEPQQTGAHPSPEALLQALLRFQEEPVLAWPEGYYDPLTKWSTEPRSSSASA